MCTLTHDYLIIGQGLAGSILALHLISAGKSVMVLDNNHKASSSMVAAGIINPVTGHRLNITEGFAEFYPAAQEYYKSLEQLLNIEIWRPVQQLRLIKNQGQLDYLNKRRNDDEYKGLISELEHNKYFPDASFGAIRIAKTAAVDVSALLRASKQWLLEQKYYECKKVDYAKFEFRETGVVYESHNAYKVIFCEGYQAINNPWLQQLPFKLSKGEILTIQTDDTSSHTQASELLNWGNWLLPNATDENHKLGSNYAWNDTSLEPSTAVKEQLLNSLKETTKLTGKAVNHEVGIRPTTKYRKPFIGSLKQTPHALCFNGFGSKGCLLIPYYAKLLTDHLITNSTLANELSECL